MTEKSPDDTPNRWTDRRHHPIAIGLMLLIMLVLLALTAWRIQENYSNPSTVFDWDNRGFSDFHNGAYFPSQAFIAGESPYSDSVAMEHSMTRATPPYSPIVFILHIPFALLSLPTARVLFFIFNFGLIAALSVCATTMSGQRFRWFDFFAITNLLLLSRPGHMTLFTGYFTAEIVLGCLVTLHFARTRPAISGLGMVFASIKPNFIIPLIIMMMFRRNYRAVAFGIPFCAMAAAAGLGWLSYHNGFEQVIADVKGGQTALHIDPTEMPVNTWTRVDLLGMYAKVVDWIPDDSVYLAFMIVFLTIIGLVGYRATSKESNQTASGLTSFITVLAILLGLYHHSYDCLLLVVPAIGILFYGKQTLPEVPRFWRTVVAFLVSIPAINYVSTKSAMELMHLEPLGFTWQSVTLINGVCLLLALIILSAIAIKAEKQTSNV